MLDDLLEEAAAATPDPERALKNLRTFCELNPDRADELSVNLRPASMLFSVSQFLANFSSSYPYALFDAIKKLNEPVSMDTLAESLTSEIQLSPINEPEMLPNTVRRFKKKALLLLTLRDVLNVVDIVDSMFELSLLADVILEASLRHIREEMKAIYGDPQGDAFSVIAVGKLGGGELNFSSDIDLLYVYGEEGGESSGLLKSSGLVKNRIGNHEYYCKLGERLNKFLSMNTEEGLAYRVDLRLRPEGQKGSLTISLAAYETYYESWGREWERAVLLRARPAAGDAQLGKAFLDMIRPFVYRKYLDFGALDEIRHMKTRIDEVFKKGDIKRGYGGIREIEFFAQALQLVYGGKEPLLRERNVLKVLHRLLQKNLVGHEDYSLLSGNYAFLRRLEHRLQQLNDLQTHLVPSDEKELAALSRKMGFPDKASFLADLDERRGSVRSIYDSLFSEERGGPAEGREVQPTGDWRPAAETMPLFAEGLSVNEIRELLGKYPLKDPEKAARNVRNIKDTTCSFQTLRGRRLLGRILPVFLDETLRGKNADAALNNLRSFAEFLASEESYLEFFAENEALIPTISRIFSRSEYLLKKIMKRIDYLESLGNELFLRKTLRSLKRELSETVSSGSSLADSIRIMRQMEEIRLGTLFLDKKIEVARLIKGLSKTAEAVISICAETLSGNGFAVIGMGKLGGREITFDSDLDVIFICDEDPNSHAKTAEKLIRLLTSYTKDGMAYRVDARLRPDGTKGPLVSTIESLQNYYSGAAHFWEFQALLKARPVAGDRSTGCRFMEMRERILTKHGSEVSAADIRGMRERIQRELAREKEGHDIKLGRGGIEELEFTVQYLQLTHGRSCRGLFVQGTIEAIERLISAGTTGRSEGELMRNTYIFYRTLESFMRLRGDTVLKEINIDDSAEFMDFSGRADFLENLKERRDRIRELFDKLLR